MLLIIFLSAFCILALFDESLNEARNAAGGGLAEIGTSSVLWSIDLPSRSCFLGRAGEDSLNLDLTITL